MVSLLKGKENHDLDETTYTLTPPPQWRVGTWYGEGFKRGREYPSRKLFYSKGMKKEQLKQQLTPCFSLKRGRLTTNGKLSTQRERNKKERQIG